MARNLLLLFCSFVLGSCVGHESEFARSLAVKVPAEVVLTNGKILTVNKDFSIQEAVAITAGRLVAVGSDGEIRRWTGPHTRVINLGGRTVIPGLIDSHIHATVASMPVSCRSPEAPRPLASTPASSGCKTLRPDDPALPIST